jgi:hypothetical protein
MSDLPCRGAGVRSLPLPLPPERMALLRRGRPLKRWRYLGFFVSDLMLCAGDVRVGPLHQQFWALAEPDRPLRERTSLRSAGVSFDGLRAYVRSAGVQVDLLVDEREGVESVHPSGRSGYVWTRKQAGVAMRGRAVVDGRAIDLDGEGAIDDTAGYHARHTAWRWSTGVGRAAGGERVAWNLVEGVNDSAKDSERTIWVDGEPFEPGPVRFAADLSAIDFADGARLSFHEWPGAVREDRINALLLRSEYRQPFGTFGGELPGGLRLEHATGVTEEHAAVW